MAISAFDFDEQEPVTREYGGVIEVDFGGTGGEDEDAPIEPGENLAERLTDSENKRIARELLELIENDIESRQPWEQRLARGLELMGVTDEPEDGPFEGAASVNHPLLAEAVTQFQSRAITELFPAGGPVKTVVVGQKDSEREEQSQRVQSHMNYQLTVEDEGYFDDYDQMLFRLPLDGSAFKKMFFDPLAGMSMARFVPSHDLIVPYSATSLQSSPRITHRLRQYPNDVKKLMAAGYYRDVEMIRPMDAEHSDLEEHIDEAEGRQHTDHPDDYEHVIYECHCDFELPGFDDEDGIARPYIITLDPDTQDVLSIRQNWRDGDDQKRKRLWLVHYKYLPGLGFYGYGLLHMIGGLSEAATGALRALLDAAAFSTLQGGFKSKEANLKGGDIELTPGEWKDVDLTAEELSKAFFTPPFKEPSMALFQLLGFLVDAGQRFSSTTESMVGDADNKGPVGTTVALIEQGSKVFSAIHKRCHKAAGTEFRTLAELNGEYIPEGGYPYLIEGEEQQIYREDYDDRVDVIPVSDPNIFSSTQRIAIAQAALQLAQSAPQMYDMYEAHRRMLEALRVPAFEELLLDPEDIERLDPMTENAAIMTGRGVKAFADQDHQAHIAVHMSFLQHPQFGGNPQAQKIIGPAMIAHIAQHVSYQYIVGLAQQGVPVQLPDLSAKKSENLLEAEIDPRTENQIALAQAKATQIFMQMPGLPPPQNQAGEVAKLQIEKQKLELEMQELQAKAQQEMAKLQQKDRSEGQKIESQKQIAAMEDRLKRMAERLEAVSEEADRELKRYEIDVKADIERERMNREDDRLDLENAEAGKPHRKRYEIVRADPADPYSPATEIVVTPVVRRQPKTATHQLPKDSD